MYRVLVPIDTDEERALSQARAVAALPNGAETIDAVLLHVFDDRDQAETTSVTQLPAGKQASEHLTDEGVSVETMSASGDPVEEIIRVAEEQNVDNIVLGGRKRSSIGSLLFGSVSHAVTLGADRPVMITGDELRARPDYICTSCGERYYTESEVNTCTNCGGVKVEAVE